MIIREWMDSVADTACIMARKDCLESSVHKRNESVEINLHDGTNVFYASFFRNNPVNDFTALKAHCRQMIEFYQRIEEWAE